MVIPFWFHLALKEILERSTMKHKRAVLIVEGASRNELRGRKRH
jgi:hypothetical protein